MKYTVKIYKSSETIFLTFNEKELVKLQKHIIKQNYDKSYTMDDGNIVEINSI